MRISDGRLLLTSLHPMKPVALSRNPSPPIPGPAIAATHVLRSTRILPRLSTRCIAAKEVAAECASIYGQGINIVED